MDKKTPASFLPFLALALILCLAAAVAVYTQITQQSVTPAAVEAVRATNSPLPVSTATQNMHISSAAEAYPAVETPTPTSAPAEHGYPAPGLPSSTRNSAPKAEGTEETATTPTTPTTSVSPTSSITPSYANYLPIILAGQYPFALQSTGVIATQGFSGCSWTGVAGQVFDLAGNPLQNLIIHLQGNWNGQPVNQNAISGNATEYGPAGYVFVLGTQPLASSNALAVQLMDANHKVLSLPILFSTYSDCAHNLILVNFIQNY